MITTFAPFVRLIIPVLMQPNDTIVRERVTPPEVGLRWGQPGATNKQQSRKKDDDVGIIVGDNQDEDRIREGVAVDAAVDHLGNVVEESVDFGSGLTLGNRNIYFIEKFIENDERTEMDGSITPIERHVRLYVKVDPFSFGIPMQSRVQSLETEYEHRT